MTLPAPRLQLKWRSPTKRELARDSVAYGGDYKWTCDYELVLPLHEHDIRRTKKRSEMALRIGRTFMSTGAQKITFDAPFRDGAHAFWDSKTLGGLPVYVINPDGTSQLMPDRSGDAG